MKIKVEDLLDLCDLSRNGLDSLYNFYLEIKEKYPDWKPEEMQEYLNTMKRQNDVVWKVCSTDLIGEKEMDDIDKQKRLLILDKLQFTKKYIEEL